MLICSDDCVIFFCFNGGLCGGFNGGLSGDFCGFNGGLSGGYVVDDEEEKNAKTKKIVVLCVAGFFSPHLKLLDFSPPFCGKTSFIYRCLDTWRSS